VVVNLLELLDVTWNECETWRRVSFHFS
jgi:hypothetical protein